MRSSTRRALIALSMLVSVTPGLGACVSAGRPVVTLAALDCSSLIPQRLRTPVEAPALPAGETVGEWIAYADAAVGRLDVANDRTATVVEIVDRCEAAEKDAQQRLNRKRFLGMF